MNEDLLIRVLKESAAEAARDSVLQTLNAIGIDAENIHECQADMLYLRKIRRGSEELPAKIKASLITVLVPTFLYIAWEAFKSKLMK